MERSYSVKVRVAELEGFLGPEDVDVDSRRILKEARDERGRKIFETFSQLEPCGKKGDGLEDYLESVRPSRSGH